MVKCSWKNEVARFYSSRRLLHCDRRGDACCFSPTPRTCLLYSLTEPRLLHHRDGRVLLNKADTIDTQQLMRVYGALMWSLGKVMQTPEVCRVYIGSFWEAPLSNFDNRFLLEV